MTSQFKGLSLEGLNITRNDSHLTNLTNITANEAIFTPVSGASSCTDDSDGEDSIYVKKPKDAYGLNGKKFHKVLDLLIETAYSAGKIIEDACPTVEAAESKQNSSDLVTEFDRKVEDHVRVTLTTAYPTFDFLGEESYKAGQKLRNQPTFIVDPIDGTLNFVQGFPNFAISLALTVDKKPVVGVIYNPVRKELFYAVKGSGAYLRRGNSTDVRLPASGKQKPLPGLTGAMIAIEWGNQRKGPNWALRTRIHNELLTSQEEGGKMCRSIRSNGSAALDFCYVAAGWYDMFWEGGCWAWDVAAGWVIVEEAGGLIVGTNPGEWEPEVEGRKYFAIRGASRSEQHNVATELWEMMGDEKFVY